MIVYILHCSSLRSQLSVLMAMWLQMLHACTCEHDFSSRSCRVMLCCLYSLDDLPSCLPVHAAHSVCTQSVVYPGAIRCHQVLLCLIDADGLLVTEHRRQGPDLQLPQPFRHHVVLTSCAGDTPAQVKMSNNKGHTGYLPCSNCKITGEYADNAVRLLGYKDPTLYGKYPKNASSIVYAL